MKRVSQRVRTMARFLTKVESMIQIKIKFVVIGGKETVIAYEEAGNTSGTTEQKKGWQENLTKWRRFEA
jgi:hypothetical protein